MRHPQPEVLAKHGRAVAKVVDDHCAAAIDLASILADHGYPTSTRGGGSGGGPSILVPDEDGNDERVPVTGTELAAIHGNPHADLPDELALALRTWWTAGLKVQGLIGRILAHASDTDVVPGGTGTCRGCVLHVCDPRRKASDRLRSGYCPSCYRQWIREGRPDRRTFERERQLKVPR